MRSQVKCTNFASMSNYHGTVGDFSRVSCECRSITRCSNLPNRNKIPLHFRNMLEILQAPLEPQCRNLHVSSSHNTTRLIVAQAYFPKVSCYIVMQNLPVSSLVGWGTRVYHPWLGNIVLWKNKCILHDVSVLLSIICLWSFVYWRHVTQLQFQHSLLIPLTCEFPWCPLLLRDFDRFLF